MTSDAQGAGWGIVGTGEISRQVVSDLLILHPARRIAVASRSAERAAEFAREFGLRAAYGSVDELLADDAVDIAYVATPHSTHADLAIRALEAGKHVLVEKPMGVDAVDVARVTEAARRHGRFAMEAMWMKFHPYYRALLDEIQSGGIGEVRSVRASFGLPFADASSPRWSAQLASSTLLDQGIYPVTLATDLLGTPESIRARARTNAGGVDLTVTATLGFDEDRFAQVAASMVDFIDPSAAISGTTGWIEVPAPFWATDRYVRHTGSLARALMEPSTVAFPREGMGYVPMLRAVVDAVAAGWHEHPVHPLKSTIAVAHILDNIRTATIQEIDA